MSHDSTAIGIDFGTTYARVGVYRNGNVEIITNDRGKLKTHSYVAFIDTERLIGDEARDQLTMNPKNTVFDTKRIIGRRFDDVSLQCDKKHWPFDVREDGDISKIQIQYKGELEEYYAEELASMILGKMKEIAEAYLEKSISRAVITVPAYFNYHQREAIYNAALTSGFSKIRLIKEPNAAAIAYNFFKRNEDTKNVLIFDMGSGKCDVTILEIEDGILEVMSTAGDTHLGGNDFDTRLVKLFVMEIKNEFEVDLSNNMQAICRLKTACEQAKCELSSADQANVAVDLLTEGIDFRTSITREHFEELCRDLLEIVLNLVRKAMRDANLLKRDIHDVVLVGGSSQIPYIQNLLQEHFNGKQLYKSIISNEAVVFGAAVYAAQIFHKKRDEFLDGLVIVDVISISLGIETAEGNMNTIIQRNDNIPTKKTRIFTTCANNQTEVLIEFYEGEQRLAKENHLLGGLLLPGIIPPPLGLSEIEITFDINEKGLLFVTASQRNTKEKKKIFSNLKKDSYWDGKVYRSVDDSRRDKMKIKRILR